MWMFTKIGFFSIVSNCNDHSQVMVQSRCEDDLKRLVEMIPEPWDRPQIIGNVGTDYSHRIFIDRNVWASISLELCTGIDYSNFKNKCHDVFPTEHKRHTMLMSIWSAAKRWQDDMTPWADWGKSQPKKKKRNSMPDDVRNFWLESYGYDDPNDEDPGY